MWLDSGQDCPRCEEKQADRLDQRRAVAAAVDAAMPRAYAVRPCSWRWCSAQAIV